MNSLFVYTTTQQIKNKKTFSALFEGLSSLLSRLTHGVIVDVQSDLRPVLTWNEKIVLM